MLQRLPSCVVFFVVLSSGSVYLTIPVNISGEYMYINASKDKG